MLLKNIKHIKLGELESSENELFYEIENKYGVRISGIFPGDGPNASTAAIIKEIDSALQKILEGDFEEITPQVENDV